MKFYYSILIGVMTLFLSFSIFAQADDECSKEIAPLPSEIEQFAGNLSQVVDGMYKNVMTLKVDYDGEGKISVYFENGKPKILRLKYYSDGKLSDLSISFSDLEKGKALEYENKSKPGRAIYLEKNGKLYENGRYNFNFGIRTNLKPPKYVNYPLTFNGDASNPTIKKNGKEVKEVVVAPGTEGLFPPKWNGSFKGASFN